MNMAWNANRMGSFCVRASGRLPRNPEVQVTPEGRYCRFCLTSEDSTEDDEHGRFTVIVQGVWFVATHLIGAASANGAHKGDQLFVEGKIRKHHWTAKGRKEDYTFVVTGYRFGARREDPGAEGAYVSGRPPSPLEHAADVAMTIAD